MGIAMTLLLALFLSFQTDIQGMQYQGLRLSQTANDAARAAALQNDLDSFIEGLITFTEDGAKMGQELVKENLKLDPSGRSDLKYYSKEDKEIHTYIFMFNQHAESIEIPRTDDAAEGDILTDEDDIKAALIDRYEIPIEIVNRLGRYSVCIDGVYRDAGDYEYGEHVSRYINGIVTLPKDFDPVIGYPTVICVIDTGEPYFRVEEFSEGATLRKAGIYEYVW